MIYCTVGCNKSPANESNEMPKGIVQFYIEKKGYGYIRVPETREEFYVRRKHLKDSIKKGDVVFFEVEEDKHGLYASKVRLEKNS